MSDLFLQLIVDLELIRRWLHHSKSEAQYGYQLVLTPAKQPNQWTASIYDGECELTGLAQKGPATVPELTHELASLIHAQLCSRRKRLQSEAAEEQRAIDDMLANWPGVKG